MSSVEMLARRFVEATTDTWFGTDEVLAEQILKEASNHKACFEKAVFIQTNQTVSQILESEFSGSALSRAKDLFYYGADLRRASNAQYFVEGATAGIDLSSFESKMFLAGGFIGMAGLAALSAPLAAGIGTALVLGTASYGAFQIINQGMNILRAPNQTAAQEAWKNLGGAFTTTALAAPFVPKSYVTAKAGWNAFIAGGDNMAAAIIAYLSRFNPPPAAATVNGGIWAVAAPMVRSAKASIPSFPTIVMMANPWVGTEPMNEITEPHTAQPQYPSGKAPTEFNIEILEATDMRTLTPESIRDLKPILTTLVEQKDFQTVQRVMRFLEHASDLTSNTDVRFEVETLTRYAMTLQ